MAAGDVDHRDATHCRNFRWSRQNPRRRKPGLPQNKERFSDPSILKEEKKKRGKQHPIGALDVPHMTTRPWKGSRKEGVGAILTEPGQRPERAVLNQKKICVQVLPLPQRKTS
jgi:hypothetical protein